MNPVARRFSQKGTTMLEVMVSILVFSFGMLGMLGLVVSSLKMTATSNYRSIASEQLAAMADALNAAPVMIDDYVAASGDNSLTAACFSSGGCAAAQLAKTEYKVWLDRVTGALPGGNAVLCRDSTPADGAPGAWACDGNGRLVVKVCWDESRVSTVVGWNTPCLVGQL